MQKQTATEKLQETFKRMREMEPTKLERGIVTALHDIYRRVFEEPWFGKPVFDILHNYNQRQGREKEKRTPDQDAGKAESPTFSHDYSPDGFYGRNQKSDDQQHGHGRGMER